MRNLGAIRPMLAGHAMNTIAILLSGFRDACLRHARFWASRPKRLHDAPEFLALPASARCSIFGSS
jgi:hypothetical protein